MTEQTHAPFSFNGTAIPILTRRWMHSNAVDEPVGFETYTASGGVGSGTEHAMYADRQGSVLWVTDPATGEVAAGYEYDGYGAITQTQGVLQQPYGYTGREFDAESGLYYYRARSYDPETGMFVQSDPIGFRAGDTNLYAYVQNDPFNWTDPSGRAAVSADYAALSFAAVGFACAAQVACNIDGEELTGPVGSIFTGLAHLIGSFTFNMQNMLNDGAGRTGSALETVTNYHGNDKRNSNDQEIYYLLDRFDGSIQKIGIRAVGKTSYSQSALAQNNVTLLVVQRVRGRALGLAMEAGHLAGYAALNKRLPPKQINFR